MLYTLEQIKSLYSKLSIEKDTVTMPKKTNKVYKKDTEYKENHVKIVTYKL